MDLETCMLSLPLSQSNVLVAGGCVQAMKVMTAPAVAPAEKKQDMVERVGRAPLVFAIAKGELPVARVIHASYVYLARW